MKQKFIALFVLLTLLLVACGGETADPDTNTLAATTLPESETDSDEDSETDGDSPTETSEPSLLRIGWMGGPDKLNPGTAILFDAFTIFNLVYDTIYQLQPDGSYTLELADSVDISDNNLVYTFHIPHGIQWHDGEPLTAHDIAYSYNLYQTHEEFPTISVMTEFFANIEAPDDNTLLITLTQAIPNIEVNLVSMPILPEHIWSQMDSTEIAEFENTEMIGSGPFKMKAYRQNEFTHLEANKDHFLNPPRIDEVIFQTFENQDALVQAIRTGQVDMIIDVPYTAYASLREAENITIVTGPPLSPSVTNIIINQTKPENCPPEDGICSGHPALLDRNVRLALAHATDKQQIIDVVLLGLGTPGLTLIPDSLGVFYNNSIQDYVFDIALANQILDKAGYADSDGDGVREMPDGSNPLIFRLNWPSDVTDGQRMAELLGDMWEQIGIGTEPQALDATVLFGLCCPAFDFDTIIWGWGSNPDPGFLLSVMTTDQIPTGTSETGYSNPEYDALYLEQGAELVKERRVELVHQMQQIVHEDVLYIIPFYAQAIYAYRTDRFTGWLTNAGKVALETPSSLLIIELVNP